MTAGEEIILYAWGLSFLKQTGYHPEAEQLRTITNHGCPPDKPL